VIAATVPNDTVKVVCSHPYCIASDESGVDKNEAINALYFPVTREDCETGEKEYEKRFSLNCRFCFHIF
jgi:hypothetical protein